MSKSPVGIAVILLVTLLSGVAFARGGGHGGGGHGGHGHGGGHGGHFGGHGFGHGHFGGRHHGSPGVTARSFSGAGAGHARPRSRGATSRSARLLTNPGARTQLVAAAALAGWHGARGTDGWWRHPAGGYGWVGPLFWPFAYYDMYDYWVWGDGVGFWDYGYPDIYAGIFAPYGYDGLVGYLAPQPSGRRRARAIRMDQLCGDDSRDIAGLPIDQIAAAIQPTEAQAAALDELGNASVEAAQLVRKACPTQAAATAPARLAAMQQRIEAMVDAVAGVQPALDKLYGALTDEQKARFNALADDRRGTALASNANPSLVQNCRAAPAGLEWPGSEIEAKLHPYGSQRAALEVLQDASAEASSALKAACLPNDIITPPARFAAIGKRLQTMLGAVKSVRSALEAFYATLTDEQKAQFEAIGPRRTS